MAWENLPSTNTPLNATNLNKITDSGSNGNGKYIKFQDGTLIQWNYNTVYDQEINTQYGSTAIYFGTRTITFPVDFYDANYALSCGEAIWGTGGSWGSCMSVISKSQGRLIFYDMFKRASGTAFHYSWIAVGRWKA